MELNKYFLFMLILICSLINISGNDSPIGTRNLETNNNGKRALDEQIDDYMIIQFDKDVSYEGGKFLSAKNYNEYISYIKIGDEIFDRNSNFAAKNYTIIEVHFNQTFHTLNNFFDSDDDGNFKSMISVDFCRFDTSFVSNMRGMFFGCSSLKTIYLPNFNTSLVTTMQSMFRKCSSLQTLYLPNFITSSVTDM